MLYFRHTGTTSATVTTPNLEKVTDQSQKPTTWLSDKPDAGFANKHPVPPTDNNSPDQNPAVPAALPILLYHGSDQETEVSDTYAPYGRMIPCETVITIDSAKIETPIISFVTEDVWHDGKLIIPAGAEVHGKAQVDPSRERIASDNNWILVWRTTDRMNGADPAQEHTALTAELEQRLKQEDQLLQTTYEQNERLAQEIKALQAEQQHVLLPVPAAESPVAAPQPKPPTDTPSQPSPVTPPSTTKTLWQWLWSKPQPNPNPKEK